ncbi:MAG TPA: ADP-ribosylglycohydrolase family protein [Verrucomicrobiae bacterium]|nr:ADP-ribosylglycohydrolase family protein [Verrucomicrobiae bacterium]
MISRRDRILGGLWGSLVGDALGVPVEFKDRATVQADPVRDMIGFGTHRQPAGTWSDDSSLLLCSVDSLIRSEFDTEDMGKRFCAWLREELWTPHGKVFDAGTTTVNALSRIAAGTRAEVAGGDSQLSNGNGSLMRILPVSVRFAALSTRELLDRVHRASALTHRHARSQMACGLFTLVIRELLRGHNASDAFTNALAAFRAFYEADPWWSVELDSFQSLLAGDLLSRREQEIASSGYVMHTLTASLWCLLTTTSFSDCVLKAVNLGGDTDTTGCVAGGLAGICYGSFSIRESWIKSLARQSEVEALFNRFAEVVVAPR